MQLNLKEVKRVYHDGRHNAFTDITRYKGKYYLTFRNGSGHVSADGKIYVLSSKDLIDWKKISVLSTDFDDRDPKFFEIKGKLGVTFFLYSYTERKAIGKSGISFYDVNKEEFSSPQIINIKGFISWRIRTHKGRLYLTAYKGGKKGEDWESVLFTSTDGINYTYVSTILKGEFASETDLTFLEDDTCLALVRREGKTPGRDRPVLAISKPPYSRWERFPLNLFLQGPLIKRIDHSLLVAGRAKKEGKTVTALFELDPKAKTLSPKLTLPSAGDTSYPGVVVEGQKRLLYLSYYSQHENEILPKKVDSPAGIYLAVIEYEFKPKPNLVEVRDEKDKGRD
ncbi:hypothetical protein LR007_00035 [candidate division NPL-UPA2 bacterium]|nr:hypothetical protein [candidate division NPL-UPA2 bacterium]